MAYTTIDDPSQHFNTILYTGNNAANRSITGAGFRPDWGWLKQRNGTGYHELYDSTRGVTKALHSNAIDAEVTTSALDSFDSDGITVSYDSSNSGSNGNGKTAVWWLWKANGGTTSSNTDGSITSTVQANTTAGFSIVTYTGTGSNATVGHGLGKQPKLVIVKGRNFSASWGVLSTDVGATKVAYLENTVYFFVSGGDSFWNDTNPTSSVFTLGNESSVNSSGVPFVAYCFAEIEGYSKIGTYTGNGTGTFGPFANGPFVYTGFKPAWVMIKRTDGSNGWNIFDNKRNPFNIVEKQLFANSNAAEEADAAHHAERDFLSNGFKLKGNGNDINADGASYLYMAFAEHPFVSSEGVPVTAR